MTACCDVLAKSGEQLRPRLQPGQMPVPVPDVPQLPNANGRAQSPPVIAGLPATTAVRREDGAPAEVQLTATVNLMAH